MDSIVEQQRQAYEDVERLEQAIVDLMLQNLTKHRYRLIREQKINGLLEQIQSRSKHLLDLETDALGLRAKESAAMADGGFDEFYARLGSIGNYHRRNPELVVRPPELDFLKYKHNPEEADEKRRARAARELASAQGEDPAADVVGDEEDETETFIDEADERELETMFSGEERFGRYVDLNEQHDLYLNIKDARRLTYLEYLAEFAKFADIPRKSKDAKYVEYLSSLRAYFEGFFARSMPLFNLAQAARESRAVFEAEWKPAAASAGDLFCAACKREFEKETTFAAHMGSRKHQKTVERLAKESGGGAAAAEHAQQRNIEQKQAAERELAWLERLVQRYAEILADKIQDTRSNVQRRQALTEHERAQEQLDDEPEQLGDDDDDQGEQLYNPLNLPLGWDGKPIPFWLYKLHGLGVKFECEICGNTVYRGRKAFERHFQEPRHATNMRRLGIPNTRQFHGVASIEEALGLWERIQRDKKQTTVNADTFEEFEDSEGNVFNKKTYLDLKRQGLI
ncbi:Pre-mRNA-splicing factor sap61 [Coemansia sp. RSA 2711]|nr:Pre-mRNA-splicing factor sap61 [Coemansia sp. RSA 2711]KAJ2321873.1 Pre-mRNA-splicing factor sap61 [Coemansia sp. RSA 2704]